MAWDAFGVGLMFAIWVLTLHLPGILGLCGRPPTPFVYDHVRYECDSEKLPNGTNLVPWTLVPDVCDPPFDYANLE